ncbi:hypothetical protein BT96DRAFT_274581 [Gymnopus androsaceus JB14]|uniref:Uncharacterized protein n=1 Tax=Gymnopus androsaceus JB14 TaxID=1447944 RepID=A0A6A4H3S3_9AGAR|nr:hypothetical protein BT96DRAFT_274581 [Gymnopus androsaceus JB14]
MFLRKKAKTAATPNPSPNPNFVSPTRAAESTSNDTPPPLFAKFATQGQSGFGNESRNGEKKPMVSGPMTLVSKRESVAASAGKGMDRAPDTARTRIQSEKPLPPPIVTPEEETQDILSSRPPQSALPINRRASNTPRISSANGADSVPPEGPGVRRITTKPTSPPSRNSSLTQPAQTQAHIASPQSLPARKSSAQDLRRKETKSSYSGHDAQRDNLIPTRPTNNQSYAPVDPPSSYRITSTAAPSSRPPSSFNNGNNNNGPVVIFWKK